MSDRLKARLALRSDLVVLVGIPLDAPKQWSRASSYTATEIVTPDGRFPVAAVKAFLIAYPNLQILDAEGRRLPIPDGFGQLMPGPARDDVTLDPAEAAAGTRLVAVRHGPSATRPTERDHYRTSLENVAGEPVRVLSFGAFVEMNGIYELSTVTRQMFSAEEFVAWYAAPAEGWIPPGATVSDPDNYGSPPALWAYYCETKSGVQFVTGAVVAR